MTTIYIIRHAMSVTNITGYFCGITDVPLSEKGYGQLDFLAKRFENVKIDAIYTSPLMRAVETAKAVNRAHKLDITLRYDLHEINVGKMENHNFEELTALYPNEFDAYLHSPGDFAAPDGESMAELASRAANAVKKIASENPRRTVAIVSHGDVIRGYTCITMGKTLDELKNLKYSYNTGVTKVEYDDDLNPHIVFSNDASHLPKLETTLSDAYLNDDTSLKG